MNPRRLSQLERAAKLKVNVLVAAGNRNEAPDTFELSAVKRVSIEGRFKVYVQVLSWTDPARIIHLPVAYDTPELATESNLADVVDRALDRFEEEWPSQTGAAG